MHQWMTGVWQPPSRQYSIFLNLLLIHGSADKSVSDLQIGTYNFLKTKITTTI